LAQCTRIKFAPGRNGTVISGRAGSNKQACYKLHAREGQRMTAHLTSPGGRTRFSILPDGYDGDFLEGANNVTDWDGELGSASGAGDFLIVVEAPRAGATFTLEVTIPRASRASESNAPPRSDATRCGDFSGVYDTQYGLLRFVRTGDQVRGSYTTEEQLKGTLTGTVHGNVLVGQWKETGIKGTLRFTLDHDGRSFTGTFAVDGDPQVNEWGGHCNDNDDR
jgi:hypothetical protein